MKNISVVDESFDINASASYHLSLEVFNEGFSYAILDTLRNKYIALRSQPFDSKAGLPVTEQLRTTLDRDIYLNRRYKSACLVYSTPDASLVPASVYAEDKRESLYRFSNPFSDDLKLITNRPDSMDARIIFSIPEVILNLFEGQQTEYRIMHQSWPFIDKKAIEARDPGEETAVSALIYPSFLDIVVFRNGKLELFNSFRYKSARDLIFYILYVYEQLGIKPDSEPLKLSGYFDDDSDMVKRLGEFISGIRLDRFNKGYSYSYTFAQIREHMFSNLINAAACV
jgi:hypothetical protein